MELLCISLGLRSEKVTETQRHHELREFANLKDTGEEALSTGPVSSGSKLKSVFTLQPWRELPKET